MASKRAGPQRDGGTVMVNDYKLPAPTATSNGGNVRSLTNTKILIPETGELVEVQEYNQRKIISLLERIAAKIGA